MGASVNLRHRAEALGLLHPLLAVQSFFLLSTLPGLDKESRMSRADPRKLCGIILDNHPRQQNSHPRTTILDNHPRQQRFSAESVKQRHWVSDPTAEKLCKAAWKKRHHLCTREHVGTSVVRIGLKTSVLFV